MALVQRRQPRRAARYAPYVRAAAQGLQLAARYQSQLAPNVTRAARAVVNTARSVLNRKRPATQQARRNTGPATTTINDGTGGGSQFRTYKYKTGKAKPQRTQQAQLMNAITTRTRFRFSGINELSAGQGFFPLSHQYITANIDHLPVYVMNLCSIRQGSASAYPLWRLYQDNVTNKLGFTSWNAKGRDGSAVADWQLEDLEGTSENPLGRKSLLDWVRVRINLWGKKTAPSRVSIQLVQFSNEDLCPEARTVLADTFTATANLERDGDQFWQATVKPLINNPCSSITRTSKHRMTVLKSWNVNIDPSLSTDNDPDPNSKFIDVFHRVGRVYDYSAAPASSQTATQLNDATQYGTVVGGTRAYPRQLESSMYLVIKSMQQDYVGSAGTMDNSQTATFDLNVQTCHKTVQASA